MEILVHHSDKHSIYDDVAAAAGGSDDLDDEMI